MALDKKAQLFDQFIRPNFNQAVDGLSVNEDDVFYADDEEVTTEEILEDIGGVGEGVLEFQVDEEDPIVEQFSFILPTVPGGEIQDPIPEPEIAVEEPEDEIKVEEESRWAWKLDNFMKWLADRMQSIPRHSGTEIVGLDRAISYLTRLKKEVSRAASADLDEVLDIKVLEKAMKEIEDGIDRLEERKEKISNYKSKGKKKKADDESSLVKEAQKAAGVQGRIVVTVPLLISRIARVLINGTVSAGHDMEDMFDKQVEEYNLNKREQAELLQLVEDMGYPIRRDRGIAPGKSIDPTKPDNFDWSAQYYA